MRLSLGRFLALRGVQIIALLCAAMVNVVTVNAATITVTTTADSGPGSLRAAIAAANNGDTIQFDAALNGQSITLTSGELVIDKNITIDGPGADQLAVKQTSPGSSIFVVRHLHTFIILGLTIDGNGTSATGVYNDRSQVALDGCVLKGCLAGGVRCFGAFTEDAYLAVFNSEIRNNQHFNAGGGIYLKADPLSQGMVLAQITNSVVSNNTVPGSSGNASGGGIWNDEGDVLITNSIVSNNVSGGNGPQVPFGNGGGIYNTGFIDLTSSTISGNSTGLFGGGIYNNNSGSIRLTRCTVSGNMAMGVNDLEGWGDGAGIYNVATMPLGQSAVVITNSTLSNNTSTHYGGAVSNSGSLTISHSTLSGNNAFEGNAIVNYSGATMQIGSTVLKVTPFSSISNHSGTITSNGYNLINDNGSGFFTATGDQINTEPMLGSLQNNGGPTFTHELLTGSPAIDAGNPTFTPPPANDQRGPLYLRVFNGRIDIGSLEVQPAPPTPTPTVTPTPTATATATATIPPTASPSPSSPGSPTPPPPPTATPSVTPFHDVDLVLTKTDSPDPVQVGHNLTYTITIANTFAHPAFNVNMSDTLPAGVNLVSVTPSQGSCTGTTTIFCNLADILHESSATVTVVVTPTAAGTLTNTATCTTTSQEFNLSNNSDTEMTTVNLAPIPTPTLTPTPTPTPTATPTVTPTPSPSPSRALNISTRMLVQTGDSVGIGGFIITGSAPKQVLLRGIGPSLAQFGVPDPLADPVLELHGPAGFVTIINDNWRDSTCAFDVCVGCGLEPPNDLDSMICATLDPGAYTAIIRGKGDTSGVALVEVYDMGPAASQLANISTRAFVSTGANVMIGGFILGGDANSQIAIFGIGPSLAASGVSGVLADPTLELRDSDGALVASNDNCGAVSIHPLDPAEACIEVSLPPGLFTAILAGKNGGTGVGLVEIYNLH